MAAAKKILDEGEVGTLAEPSSLSYEAAIAELEGIVARIEGGNVPLEESVRQYRRGAALVRRCRDILESARTEIERITATDLAKRTDG
ncbi:MAG: exodeoxyribonuclease VII small subunit [Phycisphaerales bacterium]|nr:exodeoxyribonuclease VII small subunit [Phycisphaerales bacterium]